MRYFDYADQRYHAPGVGRFMTPDSAPSTSLRDPGSWTKYAYTGGDPVNRVAVVVEAAPRGERRGSQARGHSLPVPDLHLVHHVLLRDRFSCGLTSQKHILSHVSRSHL